MSDISKIRGAFIGHSFISRLERQLQNRDCSPAQILRVGEFIEYLRFFGKSGGSIKDAASILNDTFYWYREKIDFCFLQCASNELTQNKFGASVAFMLLDLVKDFLGKTNVKLVIISLMIPRSRRLGIHSQSSFNFEKARFNEIIKNACKKSDRLMYVKLPGAETNSDSTFGWSNDGIHPNTEIGCKQYQNLVTKAIRIAMAKCSKN